MLLLLNMLLVAKAAIKYIVLATQQRYMLYEEASSAFALASAPYVFGYFRLQNSCLLRLQSHTVMLLM